jgi:hypothetical protein
MGSELLRRVRWRNVGRVCGVVLVVATVVAWPRLNSSAPRVPDPAGRPLAEPTVEPPPVTSRPRREVARPRVRRPGTAERRPRAVKRVERRREPRLGAPPASPSPPPTTVMPWDDGSADDGIVAPRDDVVPEPSPSPSPTPDPAQQEFGFEG